MPRRRKDELDFYNEIIGGDDYNESDEEDFELDLNSPEDLMKYMQIQDVAKRPRRGGIAGLGAQEFAQGFLEANPQSATQDIQRTRQENVQLDRRGLKQHSGYDPESFENEAFEKLQQELSGKNLSGIPDTVRQGLLEGKGDPHMMTVDPWFGPEKEIPIEQWARGQGADEFGDWYFREVRGLSPDYAEGERVYYDSASSEYYAPTVMNTMGRRGLKDEKDGYEPDVTDREWLERAGADRAYDVWSDPDKLATYYMQKELGGPKKTLEYIQNRLPQVLIDEGYTSADFQQYMAENPNALREMFPDKKYTDLFKAAAAGGYGPGGEEGLDSLGLSPNTEGLVGALKSGGLTGGLLGAMGLFTGAPIAAIIPAAFQAAFGSTITDMLGNALGEVAGYIGEQTGITSMLESIGQQTGISSFLSNIGFGGDGDDEGPFLGDQEGYNQSIKDMHWKPGGSLKSRTTSNAYGPTGHAGSPNVPGSGPAGGR